MQCTFSHISEWLLSIFDEDCNGCVPSQHLFVEINNENIKAKCDICWKFTTKIPERRQWLHSGVFIVNFEKISYVVCCFHCWLWTSKYRLGCIHAWFVLLQTLSFKIFFLSLWISKYWQCWRSIDGVVSKEERRDFSMQQLGILFNAVI